MGAGVAGLSAIATAKRLGAVVEASDVRIAAKEQVESLGAKFIEVEADEELETAGGYAKEASEEYKKKQSELMAQTIALSDIVITTALIPGKPAPVLITEKMVKSMNEGSIIVDLATPAGGNCELSVKDEIILKHGVKIIGYTNLASMLAPTASNLYAKNVFNLVELLVDKEKGQINIPVDDEIIKACLIK